VAVGWPLPRVARCGVDSDRYDLAVQPPLAGREGRRYGTELRTIAYGRITED
jgi:hypothetical protein